MDKDRDARSGGGVSGGNGDSVEEAVVINAPNSEIGIPLVYDYLARRFGMQGRDWHFRKQSLLQEKGRCYDRLDVTLADGAERSVFFDISAFFGRWQAG